MGTPFPLGAYLGNPDGGNASNEATFEASYKSFAALMGAAPQYLDNFVDYYQSVSGWDSNASWQAWSDAQSPLARGMTPVIALPLASLASGSPSADAQFQAIAAGQYDSVFQGIVTAYADQGFKTLAIRPGWEMNMTGPTYAGDDAASQADWVAAYQRVYTDLHQAAASAGVNLTVVWNPGVLNWSNAEATTNLYPGNAYVDAIGADVYSDIYPYSDGNNAQGQPQYHDWDTGGEDTTVAQFIADPINRAHYWSYPAAIKWVNDASSGHALSLNQLIAFAEQQGKPFVIPETGAGNAPSGTDVADDPTFPQWLGQQLTTAQQQGLHIGFVNLWNSNGGGQYEFSFAADNKPQEAAAWAKAFGAPATPTAPSHIALNGDNLTRSSKLGTVVGTLTATDSNPVTFRLTHNPYSLFSISGNSLVLARNMLKTVAAPLSITVVATDSTGGSATQKISVGVAAASAAITPATVNSGVVMPGFIPSDAPTPGGVTISDNGQGGQTIVFAAGAAHAATVWGGSGPDDFIYHAGAARAVIVDFDAAKGDTLSVDRVLQAHMQVDASGADITLSFGGAQLLRLHDPSGFAATNIHWA